MRQVQYNNSGFLLRFEMPPDWDISSITGITLGVKDEAGNELLAPAACTLFAPDAIRLNGAVAAEGNEIVIELAGAGVLPTPTEGDGIFIAQSATGPGELGETLFYNSATNTITLKRDLRYAHSDEAQVVGTYVTYDLDTSDTAVFPLGTVVVLTWTPDTDDLPVRERGEIVSSSFGFPHFVERFGSIYPREYQVANRENRLLDFLSESHSQVRSLLKLRGLDINRVVDREMLAPLIMAYARWLILLNSDENYSEQRNIALEEKNSQFNILVESPIWQDSDQDEIKSESEYSTHATWGIERGL